MLDDVVRGHDAPTGEGPIEVSGPSPTVVFLDQNEEGVVMVPVSAHALGGARAVMGLASDRDLVELALEGLGLEDPLSAILGGD